ncbi:MAG: hypothetical protein RL308_1572 [Bacteroidota bacterium]|jgi:DNA primase
MDTSLIKRIPIIQILENHGIQPAKTNSYSWFYYAFARHEKTPSLKVDLKKNLFFDHGSDQGGSVIDIVMLLKGFRVEEAIEYLIEFDSTVNYERRKDSFQNDSVEAVQTIDKVIPLAHPALIEYSKSRGIEKNFLVQYCHQIHYSVGEKSFFAIGFKNDKGGYELRNKIFKSCTSPKWFSHLKKGNEKLIIFEGFFDFLSLLTANQKSRNGYDFLILNSVSFMEKIPPEIFKDYSEILLFLDNDSAGQKATNYFLSSLSNTTDCSSLYAPFNDVNDWLTNKK